MQISNYQFNRADKNRYSNQQQNITFGKGRFQILAISDLHGGLRSLAKTMKTIEKHSNEIYPNSGEKSTFNLFAISGDWFINQAQNGYITDHNLTNGDIQLKFFKKFINRLKSLIMPNSKFDTVITPGNHDFDGGDEFLLKAVHDLPLKMVVSNLKNFEDFSDYVGKKLVKSLVLEVPDDKNPKLKHKLLILGSTVHNMEYYNKGLTKKMTFLENQNCTDEKLNDSAFLKTIEVINEEINKFKSKNPNGAVVFLSHLGNRFSDLIASSTKNIDLILNGHDHVQTINFVNKIPIISLGKDGELLRGIKINFNDDGKLDKTIVNTFLTSDTSDFEVKMHDFMIDLNKMLHDDIRPIIKINQNQYGVGELHYNTQIRYSNSPYANFLTSAIRDSLRNANIDVDTVGIQSSAIRGGIVNGSTNLDLLKTFDGIKLHISGIETAQLKGSDLVDIITENILENLKLPERNTIMHWSDIQVNRTLFDEISKGKSKKTFADAIKIRNRETGEFERIDPDKTYKTALSHKFITKDSLESSKRVRDKFTPTGIKIQEAFQTYLKDNNYTIDITPEIMESRIL